MVDEKRIIEIFEELTKKGEEIKELLAKDYAERRYLFLSLCKELNIDGESLMKTARDYVENNWDKIKQELKDKNNLWLQIEDIFKKEKENG